MKTIMKIITYPAFALFAFACFALSPTAKAQLQQPAPDGGATVTSTDVAEPAAPLTNETVFNYSLAPGANSVAHTVPANVPVLVMGVCTSLGVRGVGQVTLLHIPGFFIEWTGFYGKRRVANRNFALRLPRAGDEAGEIKLGSRRFGHQPCR